jgi:hypothetical protein
VRLHLLTAATTRPIVYPPGDISAWRAMLEWSSTGDYSWLVHQSSLAILPAVI